MDKELISIIVPCFNEEQSIPLFMEETEKVINDMKENFNLSGTEALQMSTQERIFFRKSYLKWIEKDIHYLESLGATVEVVKT